MYALFLYVHVYALEYNRIMNAVTKSMHVLHCY